ncbi:MAG: hypothetical protein OJJ21_17010 [Ferrovibrio sp.]|uniref:hypothetical protein n=1 Tax=Ferrovibrio sp. TaxID=1917215 RepID=UPI0026084603|nr:hypothetical protein [Ferrovibrio sp.]MCW0235302.1 hypothetical protein [Ferrovibrio sp.]
MAGFFLMPRGWQDHPAWRGEPFSRAQAWVWLIEEARWKPTKVSIAGKTVELQRGELSHSIRFLAERWGWGKGVVERFIGRLKTETLIETRNETGQLIISICKYDEMQASPDETETVSETPLWTAPGQHRDSTGTKKNQGNEGNEGNQTLVVADDAVLAFNAWNEMAEQYGLARAAKLTDERRQKLRRRLADAGGLDGWRYALSKVAAAGWMHGQNDSGWRADFDFLLQQKSFTRLMEGGYDRAPSKNRPSGNAFTTMDGRSFS